MAAFAANSVLAREALADGDGAWLFGFIRILSGAATLGLIFALRHSGLRGLWASGSWSGAFALSTYIALFSTAYLSLPAGLGALILFAAVQFTMLAAARRRGEVWGMANYIGFLIAVAGAVLIFAPGVSKGVSAAGRTPLIPALAMSGAGLAWGLYSLPSRKHSAPPLDRTAGNFARGALLLLALSLPVFASNRMAPLDGAGVTLAIASGALASGLGYAVWYTALPASASRRPPSPNSACPRSPPSAASFSSANPSPRSSSPPWR